VASDGSSKQHNTATHRSRGDRRRMLTSLTAYEHASVRRSTFMTEPYDPLPSAAITLKSFMLPGILVVARGDRRRVQEAAAGAVSVNGGVAQRRRQGQHQQAASSPPIEQHS